VIKLLCNAVSVLASAFLLTSCAVQEERGPVVLAASSLTQVMEDVADAWEQQGHPRPALSFAGSASLARQVQAGAPADIFFSADEQWMDWLDERGLIDTDSRRIILGNELVVVAREGLEPEGEYRESPAQLIGNARFAMGDPASVPAGRYARGALQSMGEWDALERQAVMTDSVRGALALVERGEVDYAIVYATDELAMKSGGLAGLLPADSHMPVTYTVARLSSSENVDTEAFLQFLSGKEASAIFLSAGFLLREGCVEC
jgi:molybdate transport system substrate-binding protein